MTSKGSVESLREKSFSSYHYEDVTSHEENNFFLLMIKQESQANNAAFNRIIHKIQYSETFTHYNTENTILSPFKAHI